MDFISRIITSIMDILVLPFGKSNHTLGLVWLSLLSGVAMAYIYKYTSNQAKIKRAKDRFKSCILEMRIYQDSLGSIFSALFSALRVNILYLSLALRPLLVLIIPFVIIFMQLDERYARSPFAVGATTLLSVQLGETADFANTEASLECSPGLSVTTGPIRIGAKKEIDWRLKVDSAGTHTAAISINGDQYKVPIVAEDSYLMIGTARSASSFIEAFLHPAFPPIPKNSPIQSVRIVCQGKHYPFLIWHLHWIWIFIIYSLISALAIKFLVGFEI